jgi:2-C-methyl-D-erythritol 4-phosphate cytidylyltransferase
MTPGVGVIIVAAGVSQRLGIDKMLLPLGGKPLIAWSVDVCQTCDLVDKVVVVLNKNNFDPVAKLVISRGWSKVRLCLGGARRQDSVRQGLNVLEECQWVVIHDGARPFLTPELIRCGLEAAGETGAAVAAVPAKDTIKLSSADMVVCETLPRDNVWIVQTPQVFRFDIISNAHMVVKADVTDDAELIERSGGKVKLYVGSYKNIKVTTPEDLILVETIAKEQQDSASRFRI